MTPEEREAYLKALRSASSCGQCRQPFANKTNADRCSCPCHSPIPDFDARGNRQ